MSTKPVIIIADGKTYDLGACSGRYCKKSDAFILAIVNCFVPRHKTIYKNCLVK